MGCKNCKQKKKQTQQNEQKIDSNEWKVSEEKITKEYSWINDNFEETFNSDIGNFLWKVFGFAVALALLPVLLGILIIKVFGDLFMPKIIPALLESGWKAFKSRLIKILKWFMVRNKMAQLSKREKQFANTPSYDDINVYDNNIQSDIINEDDNNIVKDE